jgi:hypothetical protein
MHGELRAIRELMERMQGRSNRVGAATSAGGWPTASAEPAEIGDATEPAEPTEPTEPAASIAPTDAPSAPRERPRVH